MNGSSWRLAAAAALGGLALAACGSAQAPGSGPAAGQASAAASAGSSPSATPSAPAAGTAAGQPALCRDAASVTSVVITRVHGYKVPELQPAFPNQVTVTDQARVRALARALCALPDMPPGPLHCPALLLGTTYSLRFAVSGRPLGLVTINASGCEAVTGVGRARRATSPAFWRVLSEAIGVKQVLPPADTHVPPAP